MSGGAYDYLFSKLEMYDGLIFQDDLELAALYHDFAGLLHDKEWYESGDISKGSYNKTKDAFKNKWIRNNASERTADLIDKQISDMKLNLIQTFGTPVYCSSCNSWHEGKADSDYGKCDRHESCLIHGFEDTCEEYISTDNIDNLRKIIKDV